MIRVVCDMCPEEPGWSGESSAAEWNVSAQAKQGNEISTLGELDACSAHLEPALNKLLTDFATATDFIKATVVPLDVTGRGR